INLLINNAGTFGPHKTPKDNAKDIRALQTALKSSWDEFMSPFNVNVTSVYFTIVAFLELLDNGNKQGIPGVSSQVITISSMAGFRKDSELTGIAYSTSKAAATHLGKILGNYLRDYRIRSNIISHGIYPKILENYRKQQQQQGLGDQPAVPTPMGRIQAGLILFLATRAGTYINGDVTISDGGRLGLYSYTF
ncbi:hypothetical protein M422DRAFT_181432, partial [Sphaerobolus stellatus SS14]